MWSGGPLCAEAVALPAVCLPGPAGYDARANAHAVRLREERAAATAARATV